LPTGTFAMQGVWANNANNGQGGCRFTQTTKRSELLRNPGFETGKLTPWVATAGVPKKKSSSFPVHAGSWLVRLGGRAAPHHPTPAPTGGGGAAPGPNRGGPPPLLAGIKSHRPAPQGPPPPPPPGAHRPRHGA